MGFWVCRNLCCSAGGVGVLALRGFSLGEILARSFERLDAARGRASEIPLGWEEAEKRCRLVPRSAAPRAVPLPRLGGNRSGLSTHSKRWS